MRSKRLCAAQSRPTRLPEISAANFLPSKRPPRSSRGWGNRSCAVWFALRSAEDIEKSPAARLRTSQEGASAARPRGSRKWRSYEFGHRETRDEDDRGDSDCGDPKRDRTLPGGDGLFYGRGAGYLARRAPRADARSRTDL